MSKKGLGRGLGALIPEVDVVDRENIMELDVHSISPNPRQPRKMFDEGKLEELASSIREHGVVQPIVVRPREGRYEIVAGERRWRAAQVAGLATIPAVVREFTEAQVMEIALIENLQREDLNPLEEAEAYRLLMEECHLTQEELAVRLGKSRPQISNTLRLLQLSSVAREEVRAGRLSMGHAKVLLSVGEAEAQGRLAERVAEQGLSVRQLEDLLKQSGGESSSGFRKKAAGRPGLPPVLRDVERRLGEFFGTPVKLSLSEGKGRIEITFFGEEGLERVLEAVGIGERSAVLPPKGEFRV